jgi:hypothetical protein
MIRWSQARSVPRTAAVSVRPAPSLLLHRPQCGEGRGVDRGVLGSLFLIFHPSDENL